jgi:xanthine dehydrogenase accessory factor
MDSIVLPFLRHAERPDGASLVRIVSLSGFGLRSGSDGAIVSSGGVDGSLLGGLLDSVVADTHAAGPGERHLIRTKVTDQVADAAGMVCGGSARLLISPLADLPPLFADAIRTAEPVAVVTTVPDGRDLVVTRRATDGSVSEDPDQDRVAVETARRALAEGVSASTLDVIDGVEFVISVIVPAARALIVGNGAMAHAIAAQGALLGWHTTIDESPGVGLDFLSTAGPADALIILTHDPELDTPLLSAALHSSVGYLGAMGSRGTQTNRRKRLLALGHDESSFGRIHGPVGLDLGSRTPAETAVAIAAEYLVLRSGRRPVPLTETAGPING